MPYAVDHEVSVGVSVAIDVPYHPGTDHELGKPGVYTISVDAISLDHDVDRIAIWDRNGKYVLDPRGDPPAFVNPPKPKQGPRVGITSPDGGPVQLKTRWSISQTVEGWQGPFAIDVYEAADATEASDVHRHGWFGDLQSPDESGALDPVDAQGHPLDPAKSQTASGFYPMIAEFPAPASGDAEGPKYETP